MTVTATIHSCEYAADRQLADMVIAMVPKLGATRLIELEDRLQENVRDERISYGHERGDLVLYLKGRHFITFTKNI